ncbi:hypothetical protein J3E69DRAFT_191755 [Trichoderma sp. SZMC 28015]
MVKVMVQVTVQIPDPGLLRFFFIFLLFFSISLFLSLLPVFFLAPPLLSAFPRSSTTHAGGAIHRLLQRQLPQRELLPEVYEYPVPHIRCTSDLVQLLRTPGIVCLEHDLILHPPAMYILIRMNMGLIG